MATENQFILFYRLHQRPTDTRCFIPHMERLAASSLPMPKTVIADAGYGSEEDCSDCPLKSACTTAKGNRQVHWNAVWEELKAKAQAALEDDETSAIYARRKVEVESVFGHIKGNRSFRRFSLRGLDKVWTENRIGFPSTFHFRDFLDNPFPVAPLFR
jgi:hypothetical protein